MTAKHDDELLHEVLAAARRSFVPAHDTRVIERPGWMQLITPSLRDGGLNEVALAVLDEAEVDAVLDATIAEYRELGIRFRWTVDPESRPLDLVARLAARGLVPETVLCLVCPPQPLLAEPAAGVTVELVDAHNIEAYSEVMAAGWNMLVAPLLAFNRRVLAAGSERSSMQLAYVDGKPAASAAVFWSSRTAQLLGAVVLPEFRGRGIYRALVAKRAELAVERGVELLTTHAREHTSAPILLGLGFRELCRLTMMLDQPLQIA